MLPAGVMRNTNNASNFKIHNPADVVGDTSPDVPQPPPPKQQKNCGVFGQVLMVVIAVVVATVVSAGVAGLMSGKGFLGGVSALAKPGATIAGIAGGAGKGFVAGAIGGAARSIASQGVGVATGIQEKFSWNAVGMAALSGGVGANSAPATSGWRAAANGAVRSAVTQGIGVAVGLQSKFSWAGVAAAGVSAGVIHELGQTGWVQTMNSPIGQRLVMGTAGAAANAATRSLIEGTDFGDNLIAALPDVIGQTIGGMISDRIVQEAHVNEAMSEVRERVAARGFEPEQAQQIEQTIEAIIRGDVSSVLNMGEAGDDVDRWWEEPLSTGVTSNRQLAALLSGGEEPAFAVAMMERVNSLIENAETPRDRMLAEDVRNRFLRIAVAIDVYSDDQIRGLLPSYINRMDDIDLAEIGLTFADLVDADTGYYAAVYYNSRDDQIYYVNRGTDFETIEDWITNVANGLGYIDAQYVRAVQNARAIQEAGEYLHKTEFIGHSLGGGLAATQALAVGGAGVTFNSAGANGDVVRRFGGDISQAENFVVAYNVEGDILSFIQDNRIKIARELNDRGMRQLAMQAAEMPVAVGHRERLQAFYHTRALPDQWYDPHADNPIYMRTRMMQPEIFTSINSGSVSQVLALHSMSFMMVSMLQEYYWGRR